MLRAGAHEISTSALRFQIPFPCTSLAPKSISTNLIHRRPSIIPITKWGFRRVYVQSALYALHPRSFASKPHCPTLEIESFSAEPAVKKQSLLYKARAATAGLQENWADVETDDETHLSDSSDGNDEKELEEFSEEWRRRKIAWLCKELPAHDPAPMIRILNRQRKWIQQEDVKYIITHLLRIRENNIGHRDGSFSMLRSEDYNHSILTLYWVSSLKCLLVAHFVLTNFIIS